MGGIDLIHDVLSSVEAHNPVDDTWSYVASMPTPRTGLAAAVGPDGTIYALGGDNNSSTFLDTMEAFDPSSGSCRAIAPMPTARRKLASAASVLFGNTKIFAMGGHGVEFPLTTMEVYTP